MSAEALNILDVLENLNTIVDANTLEEIEVADEAHLISHTFEEQEAQEAPEQRVYWVTAGANEQTLDVVKTTFSSVLAYLKHSYTKMEKGQDPLHVIEGINTIMVLVGEAGKKMENLGLLVKNRILEVQEYKELQDFYQNTIIKGAYKNYAKDLQLQERKKTKEIEIQEDEGIHLLNDIDLVKRDQRYELFYLKNEAGYSFYTKELSRKIKLACDFGEFSQQFFAEDPLLQIMNWEDRTVNIVAKNILTNAKKKITSFYKQAGHFKDVSMVVQLNNALMALMLASNTRNLIRQFSPKGSHLYFADFQHFLRELLLSRDYQRQMLYPSDQPFFNLVAELGQELAYQLYNVHQKTDELMHALEELSELSLVKEGTKFSDVLKESYSKLEGALQAHPSGPVFKALDLIREEEENIVFDPLMQGNIPSMEATLKDEDHEIEVLRMACPTLQEVINRAYITEEFKSYLRRSLFNKSDFHHLIINYQDRTSWKEFARCKALEDLSHQAEFSDLLTIVTFATDTDFYHQSGVYETLADAHTFMDHIKQHLFDVSSGFVIPKEIKTEEFVGFIDQLLAKIHKNFFQGQDLLSLADRKSFIELVYAFVELKILELTHSTTLSLSSKDGLDQSATATLSLFALLLLNENNSISKEKLPHLFNTLFGPTLMVRERLITRDHFDRLVGLVQLLEKNQGYLKAFDTLFDANTLNLKPEEL